ncbi:MAG: hypothetical protein F4X52_13890, partial [Acidimicrobiaceae bacterium]|nr:hypothetical protein [Acidimicrobiaceae bacterium]
MNPCGAITGSFTVRTAGVVVGESAVTVREDGTDSGSWSVVLASGPTHDVRVTVASGDPSAVQVKSGSGSLGSEVVLTFTPGGWDTAQTVTVQGVPDDVDNLGDKRTAAVSHTAASVDSNYEGRTGGSVSVTVTDDDAAPTGIGLSVSPTKITESATGTGRDVTVTATVQGATTFGVSKTVRVTAAKTGGVGVAAIDPFDVVILAGEASGSATVTVVPEADEVDETDAVVSFSGVVTGDSSVSVTGESVSVVVSDDDAAGVVVSESAVTVKEDGSDSGSWTVKLASEPTHDVEVSVVSGDSSAVLVDGAGSVVLTFTPDSWDTAQTVTVQGVPDVVDNTGDKRTVAVSHTAVSVDSNYGGVTGESVSVVVSDDDAAGVVVSESAVTVKEDGSDSGSWTVKLASEPTHDVEVSVVSGDSSAVLVDGAGSVVLTFTPDSWDTAQTVTVQGVPDVVDNTGDKRTVAVSHTAVSVDSNYGGVTGESVSVVVSDDDTAGVRLGIVSSLTVPEDGSRRGSWSVVLGSEPTADVEVSVVSGDSSAVLVDGGGSVVLTFTPGSWDTAQTVTVVGVDDDVDNSGDSRSVSVSHSVSSVDVDYDGFLVSSVTVVVSDDDTAGVVVSDGVLFLGERDSGVYSVVLASDPVDDVVVSVFSGDPSAVTVDTDRTERGLQRRLTFNGGVSGVAGAWDVKQNVLVVAVGDDDVDSEQGVRVMHTVNRRGPYGGVVVDDVLVYVADDDARANKGLTARFGGFVGDGDGVLVEGESTRLRYRLSDELAEGETVSLLLRLSGGVVGEDYSLSLAGSGEGVSLSVPEASGGSVVASVVLTFTGGAQEALLKVSTIAGGGAGDGAEDCVPTEVVTCEPGLGDWFLAVGLVAAYSPDGSVQERDGVGGVRLKDGPQTTRLHVLPRDRVVVEGFTPNNFVSGIWKVPSSEGAVAYEVSLGSDPGGTVTVTPVSSDSSVAAVSPALTFDSDDWDTAQTVTVTVADVGAVTVSHAVEGYGSVTAGPDVGLLVVVFPVAQFAQNSYSAGEAPRRRSVDVGVSLSAPAPAGGLTVAYTVAGTAASGVDYTELSGSVAVAAGETAATVSVAVVDDRVDEDDETIVLTLADGAGYTVGTDKATTVTVTDDDRAGVRLSVGSAS